VDWRPETLARKINTKLAEQSTRRIHAKTPYRWLKRGEIPHAPVPEIVVLLLAEATGQPLAFHDVWPGRASRSQTCLPADHGTDVAWTREGLLRLLQGWPHTMLARRRFIALSGAALTGPAWEWMDSPAPTMAADAAQGGGRVTPEMLAIVEGVVVGAQQMDDQHGAAAADFVSDQFACVSRLLRRASYDAVAGRRLCAALAQLAQTAGFMAYEKAQDGTAQHWYLTALHAAHSADEHGLAASILALISNQQAEIPGKTNEALQLAAAAQKAADHAPAAVQALIAARSGLAYAAAGDLAGFQRTRDQSLHAIDRADPRQDQTPRWAQYVSPTELDAIAGRGLVNLAQHITGRQQQLLLTTATTLLHNRAQHPTHAYQRSALRHATWLGLAHIRSGNLDQAVTAARSALQNAPQVTSQRCLNLLRELQDNLAPHAHRVPAVRDLLADLNHTLPTR
jgi:hypothetical protein